MLNDDLSNVTLVTHRGCLDGSTCAILFLAAGGLRKNIIFSSPSHDSMDEVVKDHLEVSENSLLVADVSISPKLAGTIVRDDIVLLDHHKTAIPLDKYPWARIDKENTKCGSMLLYDWLFENYPNYRDALVKYEALVKLADDRDRWVKSCGESDRLAELHNFLGQDLFIDRFLANSYPLPTDNEKYILGIVQKKLQNEIKNKKKNVIVVTKNINEKPYNLGFVFGGNVSQSDLGNAICNDPELNVDIAVVVTGYGVSLRGSSITDADLSIVSKLNGGGGHRLAAGFGWKSILGSDLVSKVIDNIKLT